MIKGKDVELHAVCDSDIEFIHHSLNNTDLHQYTSHYWPSSHDEIREECMNYSGHNYNGSYFIIKKNLNNIGVVKLTTIEWISRSAELNIFLDSKYRGMKYGSDAIKTILDYAFNRLNLHQVYLYVYQNNESGIRCYVKCGFQIDGSIRDCKYLNGSFVSAYRMSILSTEYFQTK